MMAKRRELGLTDGTQLISWRLIRR